MIDALITKEIYVSANIVLQTINAHLDNAINISVLASPLLAT
jgi:hypothetical protein